MLQRHMRCPVIKGEGAQALKNKGHCFFLCAPSLISSYIFIVLWALDFQRSFQNPHQWGSIYIRKIRAQPRSLNKTDTH